MLLQKIHLPRIQTASSIDIVNSQLSNFSKQLQYAFDRYNKHNNARLNIIGFRVSLGTFNSELSKFI